MPIKKPLKKPVSKRMKRFDEGGYTGDDPIVKYRMGKLSEADTYDALGKKDLADVARAKSKETTKTNVTPVVKTKASETQGEVIDMRSNPKNVISKETRDAALESKYMRNFISKNYNPGSAKNSSLTPDRLARADVDNEYPETKDTLNAVAYLGPKNKPEYMDAGYKKGGKVAGKLATRGYGKAR